MRTILILTLSALALTAADPIPPTPAKPTAAPVLTDKQKADLALLYMDAKDAVRVAQLLAELVQMRSANFGAVDVNALAQMAAQTARDKNGMVTAMVRSVCGTGGDIARDEKGDMICVRHQAPPVDQPAAK